VLFLFIIVFTNCFSAEWKSISDGQLTILQSSFSPFPHNQRKNGHTYDDSLYTFEEHYNDSSVAIFIPKNFHQSDSTDLVFYFHGWNNNINKSIEKFNLLDQFSASYKNAIFIFPQGPKNAPDSFGGRLEEKDVFKNLVDEVLLFLYNEKKITSKIPGRIIISGHSGAYRVISFILNRGGLTDNITEVYLFDGFYAQQHKYTHWIENHKGRFINIITPDGGTYNNSLNFLADLKDWEIPFQIYDKNKITEPELIGKKIIFIFTSLKHSDVINPYFELLLKTSQLKKII
jgi:hypothetical protein